MELVTFSQYFERRDHKELDNVIPVCYTEDIPPVLKEITYVNPVLDTETMQQQVSVAFSDGTGEVFELSDELYLKRKDFQYEPEPQPC